MLLAESLLGSSSAAESTFVEDVFSTWLYTGNGVGQNILNGIQLGAGATSPGWIATLGGSFEGGNSVAVDSAGNVYVCGSTNASGNSDLQIVKYNASGALQWQRRLGGTENDSASSVAVDSVGNVYLCGFARVSGNFNLQLVKYNTDGAIQWQRSLSSPESDFGNSVAVDSSGNVYVCGSHNVSGRSTEILIAKYNTNGVIQWQRSLGAVANDVGNSVAVDSSGNVYVCGSSNFAGIGNDDFQIAKYNTNGVIQWQRCLGSAFADRGNSVSVDSVGNVYVCGESRAPAGINQFLIAKYNTSGSIQWQRSLGASANSDGRGAAVDSSGNVYVCGSSNNDFQIAKYDTNGGLLWQRSLGSSATEGGNSVAVDNSGNVYVAGFTTADNGRFLFAKLPGDGSGSGSYTIGASTFVYAPSFLTNATSSLTDAASSLTDVAGSLTDAASSLTDVASSLTSSTTALVEGPGKGGLVWMKGRSGATDHALYDTARGATFEIGSDSTAAQTTQSQGLTSFLANGFSIGSRSNINTNGATQVSWTFREQPKFFDVVTYAGNGINGTAIPHSLGSVPGCIIIKRTDTTGDWFVYHRSYNGGINPEQYTTYLNQTAAVAGPGAYSQFQAPTATVFYPGAAVNSVSASARYVAYIFAHDAGGFGATGADNVISCGSFTTNSSGNATVTLGYEPQWILHKPSSSGGNWEISDVMRGWSNTSINRLYPDSPSSEQTYTANIPNAPNATGFQFTGLLNASSTYIYIAIRRGPMRTPTSGTSVFAPVLWTTPSSPSPVNLGFPADASLRLRRGSFNDPWFISRLTGGGVLITSNADAEATNRVYQNWDNQQGYWDNAQVTDGQPQVIEGFRRAPGFFDVVCYTGDGTGDQIVNHNLGVMPDLTIVKARSNSSNWWVASKLNETRYYVGGNTQPLYLNSTASDSLDDYPVSSYFNSSTFRTSAFWTPDPSASGHTYVAYLFASCPGVSKVGSYTGTGATQIINCGFSSGARFILIRRIGATGDWYVWDSARGIVAGNDPYLRLNSTAAEVTNTDWVDAAASGFELSNAGGNLVNTNGGSYIFLAIA